jgi:hypothetical protein
MNASFMYTNDPFAGMNASMVRVNDSLMLMKKERGEQETGERR